MTGTVIRYRSWGETETFQQCLRREELCSLTAEGKKLLLKRLVVDISTLYLLLDLLEELKYDMCWVGGVRRHV